MLTRNSGILEVVGHVPDFGEQKLCHLQLPVIDLAARQE